jgi:hypothetical protein
VRPALVVLSEVDPVASRLAERWGTPPSTGEFVEGAAVRQLSPTVRTVRRPGRHILDEHLDRRLPPGLGGGSVTLIFPSIHRSARAMDKPSDHVPVVAELTHEAP